MEQKLKEYYQYSWEKWWIKSLDSNFRPKYWTYKYRMLDTLKFINERVDRNTKFTLLDAGCGIGIYAINILKLFPDCVVSGFDISPEQIDYANTQLEKLSLVARGHFFIDDIEKKSNYEEKSFDFIVCTEVLEHLVDPSKALKNLYERGSGDTIYIFSVPLLFNKSKSDWFYRQFKNNDDWFETKDFSKINQNRHYYAYYHKKYSLKEINNLLAEHQFEVLEISFCCFVLAAGKYIDYAYSLFSNYTIDKMVNWITRGRFASQVILVCRKIS